MSAPSVSDVTVRFNASITLSPGKSADLSSPLQTRRAELQSDELL